MHTSHKQSIISFFILLLLIFIAAAIGFKQQSFQTAASQDTPLKDTLFGDKFNRLGELESYTPTNLYEKIDGKADLYLNNGFISLQSCRFAQASAADKWAEVYLYDMGNSENSFAVYSMQKRSDAVALDWAQFGYSTSDAIYAAAGKYYIEVALSSDDPALLSSTSAAIKPLAASISSGKIEIPYINLFPKENFQPDTFKFISTDAFGSELKNVFAGQYKIKENTATAYLCKDPKGQSYDYYHKFLIDNGGTEKDLKSENFKAVELYGTTDIIFKTKDFFAGVRGSSDINDLKLIAEKFNESLSSKK